jgi:hypothetical protein
MRNKQTPGRKAATTYWQMLVKAEVLKLHRRGVLFDEALLEWARK